MNPQGLAIRPTALLALACAALLALTTGTGVSAQSTVLVRGAAVEDLNGDGAFGPTEPGLGGVLVEVYADANGNGQVDAGEPVLGSGTSFSDGFYAIPGMPSGFAVVRVHPPVGFAPTVGPDVAVELIGGPVNPEVVVDYPMVATSVSAELTIAHAEYRSKDVTDDVFAADDALYVDVYDREKRFENLLLHGWNYGGYAPSTQVVSAKMRVRVSISYNGAALEAKQVLPDGSVISLGSVTPPAQNGYIDLDFDFDISGISTLSDLCATELRLSVNDPDEDQGPNEHIKVDQTTVLVELLP